MTIPHQAPHFRIGKWLPSDQEKLDAWLKKITVEAVQQNAGRTLLPPVQMFKDLIESNPHLKANIEKMFEEVPTAPLYQKDGFNRPEVRSIEQMLLLMNHVIQRSPEWSDNLLIGCPMNAIFNWSMATKAGQEVFLNPLVNDAMRDILDYWANYLTTPDSAYILNQGPDGWLNPTAIKQMEQAADGESFTALFKTKSDDINQKFGFTSWDEFFTREWNDGVRPIEAADDPNAVLNACESAPYCIATNAKAEDQYWIKGQPYSLKDIFGNDPVYENFVGGTIYQAFLSALSYHRWHAPIDGTVKKIYHIPGAYYSGSYSEGFAAGSEMDPADPDCSQAYLSEVAARAVMIIEADNKAIGTIAFVPIGMVEISTCEFTVKEGDHITKGQEMGMFHFGGSTHLLVFPPHLDVEFDLKGQTPNFNATNLKVRTKLATIKPRV